MRSSGQEEEGNEGSRERLLLAGQLLGSSSGALPIRQTAGVSGGCAHTPGLLDELQ